MIIGSGIAYFTFMDESRYVIVYSLPLTLLPYFLGLKYKRFEKYMSIYIIFIFISHFLGSIMELYLTIPYYDKFTHFISGILISFIVVGLTKLKMPLMILFIISITLSSAVIWEFFEFFSDIIFNGNAQRADTTGVDDTMLDMFMAFSASILFCMGYWRIYGERTVSRI